MADGESTLGILQLDNRAVRFRGSLCNPKTFGFPILCRKVPGAAVTNSVAGDPGMEEMWVAVARSLVRDGVSAITTTCGFALRYQKAIATSVNVPVSTSSLLLLPYVRQTLPSGKKVGILTFDARCFDGSLFELAGLSSSADVVLRGCEGTEAHRIMSLPDNPITVDQLRDTVIPMALSMVKDHDIGALLIECVAFCAISQDIRESTKLPVWDITDNARLLMSGRGFNCHSVS